MKIKAGIKLLEEEIGNGEPLQRQNYYELAIRVSLNRGEIISTPDKCLSHVMDKNNRVTDDGFFQHRVRFNRECLIAGIFYALDGMKVGGRRKVVISPHLAYGEQGIPGIIPANAVITAEIRVLAPAKSH